MKEYKTWADRYHLEILNLAPAPGWKAFECSILEAGKDRPEEFYSSELIVVGWATLRYIPRSGITPLMDGEIRLACLDAKETGYFILLEPFRSKELHDWMTASNSRYAVIWPGNELNPVEMEKFVRFEMEWEAKRKGPDDRPTH